MYGEEDPSGFADADGESLMAAAPLPISAGAGAGAGAGAEADLMELPLPPCHPSAETVKKAMADGSDVAMAEKYAECEKTKKARGCPCPKGLTVYWGSGSPPAWRVTACLHEKRIPHHSELISFESNVLRSPVFRALNPRCLVPILIDGGTRLYESLAILDYLEHFYTDVPLLPADKATRALALTRTHEANNVSTAAGEVVYYVRRTPPEDINEEYLDCKRSALREELELWNMYLTGNEYLAGSVFTMADISFFPNLAYMVRLGLSLTPFPNLARYFAQLCRRPSFIETWPPHWKEGPGLPLLA